MDKTVAKYTVATAALSLVALTTAYKLGKRDGRKEAISAIITVAREELNEMLKEKKSAN
jgi:hypothetical protein